MTRMAGDELGVRMSNDNKKHRDRSLEIGNRGDGKGSGIFRILICI